MSQTRRDFVKSTSLITGSLIAAPFLSEASMFNSLVDDTIKVALIGCGGRGTGAAIQALSTKQNVKLVAMADAFQDRLDNCYKEITGDDFENLKSKIVTLSAVEVSRYLIIFIKVLILNTPILILPHELHQKT